MWWLIWRNVFPYPLFCHSFEGIYYMHLFKLQQRALYNFLVKSKLQLKIRFLSKICIFLEMQSFFWVISYPSNDDDCSLASGFFLPFFLAIAIKFCFRLDGQFNQVIRSEIFLKVQFNLFLYHEFDFTTKFLLYSDDVRTDWLKN